jgi:hypothetical protein
MNESAFWRSIRKKFLEDLRDLRKDFKRIENNVSSGTPDVNYCIEGEEGWIELKHAKEWPKRGGPLKLKHFTPEQRLWIHTRQKAGGKAFVLLKVAKDYFLFWDCDGVGQNLNREELIQLSEVHTCGSFPTEEILFVLRFVSLNPK